MLLHYLFFITVQSKISINTANSTNNIYINKWGRQSPQPVDWGGSPPRSPPPMYPEKPVSRQSSFSKIGNMLNKAINVQRGKINIKTFTNRIFFIKEIITEKMLNQI